MIIPPVREKVRSFAGVIINPLLSALLSTWSILDAIVQEIKPIINIARIDIDDNIIDFIRIDLSPIDLYTMASFKIYGYIAEL